MALTDIKTNLPFALLAQMRKKEAEARESEDIAEGIALGDELASSEGNRLIREIIEQLDSRIKQLMKSDEECQALLKLASKMGTKVKRGRQLAEKMTMENLGMDEE